ncbi:MAG: hypothetical protein IJ362_05425 [Oscillospiraceae bacterium]|nr:hypothetical protein [Oscillospiraceae bacterium]
MKRKHIAVVFTVLFTYFLALGLLVYAESFSPDASILSMKDALWYSIVTLTTVGYGDLSPVTTAGKLIGAVFLLLSTSLVALLVALVMTFGQVCSRLRLAMLQGRKWHIFSALNTHTAQLAAEIMAETPQAVIIFPKDGEEKYKEAAAELKRKGAFFIRGSVAEILSLKKQPQGSALFFMDADGYGNYRDALAFAGRQLDIYCQSGYQGAGTPYDIILFSAHEMCARLYWQQHPLAADAESVVIIGGGSYATALLEQALQVNVFSPQQSIKYHLFAEDESFTDMHPGLSQVLAVNCEKQDTDSLFVYTAPWQQHARIITEADRVIICADEDRQNLKNYSDINRYFATKGSVHLKLSYALVDADCFGADSSLYTPPLVMRSALNSVAMAMHQTYLDSTGSTGPLWRELSPFTRGSNISSADHLQTKIRILMGDDISTEITEDICRTAYDRYLATRAEKADVYRRIEHIRWMRFHALHNWTYAPVRNNALRHHPSMVPFDRLKPADREKDDFAWQIMLQLADILKK